MFQNFRGVHRDHRLLFDPQSSFPAQDLLWTSVAQADHEKPGGFHRPEFSTTSVRDKM